MSGGRRPLAQSALELRRAFDASFAEPALLHQAAGHDVLLVRVQAHPFALRTGEIAGLFQGRRVAPVPGAPPGLLGIAFLRGGFVPVFELGVLLGLPQGDPPRWLALAAGRERAAVAFDAFLGQSRVGREEVVAAQPGAVTRHVQDACRVADVVYPIVELRPLVEAIAAGADATPAKEP